MGLSASQARLLSITSRLSDNELRSQTITNAKSALSTKTSQASQEYLNSLNETKMMFSTYDANGNKWVNMVSAGIIDPVKVTRSALQNAASIAALILTSECAITDIPAPEPAPAANPGMGGMM